MFSAKKIPAVILNFSGDRSHVPPPSRSPVGCGFLLCPCCVQQRDCAAESWLQWLRRCHRRVPL